MRDRVDRQFAVALCVATLAFLHFQAGTAIAQGTREVQVTAASTVPPVPLLAGIGEGRIRLDAVVSDTARKPVSGLREQDFMLLDNGARQKILSFHAWDGVAARSDPPVELVVVIDAVNASSADAAVAEREAQKFLRAHSGHLAQPTSVYWFSHKGLYGNPEPSQDGNALAASLEHPKELPPVWRADSDFNSLGLLDFQVGLSSGLLSRRALEVLALEERRKTGRKLVFWLGSGWPPPENGGALTHSAAERWIAELSTRLREARIELYRLPTIAGEAHLRKALDEAKSRPGILSQNLTLEALALQSGGRSLDASDDLAEQIELCVRDAPVFYTLTFDPPRAATADEYHDLKLETADSGLTVRTRSGYYDEPGFYDQPDPGVKPVTVRELEAILEEAPSRNDKELAQMLAGVDLTERLSKVKFAAWKARMPGAKSRSALIALADSSAFLDPPADEIPGLPIPDLATRRQMMARTIDYLKDTIPKLPNFYAKRTTMRYEEPPTAGYSGIGAKDAPPARELLSKDVTTETVLYRGGHETVEESKPKSRPGAVDHGLQTLGTFGPILGIVVVDMAHGSVAWSRWEQGVHGPVAVFRYTVPAPESHYEVAHCCVPAGDGTAPVQGFPGYHGEISIDPAQGTILRLTVEADLAPRQPPPLSIVRSDILVEYGEVAIGGATYTCPVRSVSISRTRTLRVFQQWGVQLPVYGPFATQMGDTSFTDYHMFRSESRLILDPEPAP